MRDAWIRGFVPLVVILVLVGAAASGVRADVDVELPNRARVSAVFADAAEVHDYRVICPAGALLTAVARPARGGPRLLVRVLGADGLELARSEGERAVRVQAVAPTSGAHVVEVVARGAATAGRYLLSVEWKSPTVVAATRTLEPADDDELVFAGDQGAIATLTLRAPRGSRATPGFESVVRPDGESIELPPVRRVRISMPLSGDYALRYAAGAAGGTVDVRVRIQPPKVERSFFHVDTSSRWHCGEAPVTTHIGPHGGRLEVNSGLLSGASVSLPPGALAVSACITLGAAPPLSGAVPGAAGGPAVSVGPEGLALAEGGEADVTIPYDADVFGADTSTLVVFARDATGSVAAVAGTTIDAAHRTVAFRTPRLGAFQAIRPLRIVERQRIDDGAGSVQAALGGVVAYSVDLVAAREVDEQDVDQGRPRLSNVALYRRCGDVFGIEARLYAPNPVANDGFGASIAVAENRVVVGANLRRDERHAQTGAAIVFDRDLQGNWSTGTEIFAEGSNALAFVGSSVALDGDTLLVGAPRDSAAEPAAGAVHVFVRDAGTLAWTLGQTLRLVTPRTDALFGAAVALQDGVAVVGAPGERAVYVFRCVGTTWTQAARLDAPDLGDGGSFGANVALDDGTVAIAAFPHAADGPSPGGVRVFRDDGSSVAEEARFTAADVVVPGEPVGVGLGTRIALRGDLMIAGAPTASVVRPGGDGTPVSGSGNAFVFQRVRGTWRYVARLRGRSDDRFPIGAAHQFGGAVALDGTTAVVGSQFDDAAKPAGGALFVFDLAGY